MSLFRRARRLRAGTATAFPALTPRPRVTLSEQLQEIAAAATAPEDALEPALRAILETSTARAGAICLFDQRHALLRLAAEVGLSDEGCQRLRSVRHGDPTAWDMPLHGLLNRRAYLIESAARNRYVPRLVDPISAVRTVACIPLYAGVAPLGSLVLVAVAPRSFGERDVRSLERPLRELARIIEAVRRRAGADEENPVVPLPRVASPAVAGELSAVVAERERLQVETAAHLAERTRVREELAGLRAERERLQNALEAAADEQARLATDLQGARRDAERIDALTAALAAAEQERARLAASLEAQAAERTVQTRSEIADRHARAEAERAVSVARAELEVARQAAASGAADAAALLGERHAEVERLVARLTRAEASSGRRCRVNSVCGKSSMPRPCAPSLACPNSSPPARRSGLRKRHTPRSRRRPRTCVPRSTAPGRSSRRSRTKPPVGERTSSSSKPRRERSRSNRSGWKHGSRRRAPARARTRGGSRPSIGRWWPCATSATASPMRCGRTRRKRARGQRGWRR